MSSCLGPAGVGTRRVGVVEKFSCPLKNQYKGDYDAALTQYQKSMEIDEKIGDIAGAALSMAQLGTLYFNQNKFETALEYFIQAFLVFAKIGSPYANQARKGISRVREKLPQEQFNAILKEFNLTPEAVS